MARVNGRKTFVGPPPPSVRRFFVRLAEHNTRAEPFNYVSIYPPSRVRNIVNNFRFYRTNDTDDPPPLGPQPAYGFPGRTAVKNGGGGGEAK